MASESTLTSTLGRREATTGGPRITLTGPGYSREEQAMALRPGRDLPTPSAIRKDGQPSPCSVCGGPVPATGRTGVSAGGWRQHRACVNLQPADVVKIVTGRTVSALDAALLAAHDLIPGGFHETPRARPTGDPAEPWAHVTRGQRRKLLAAMTKDLDGWRAEKLAPKGLPDEWLAGCAYCGRYADRRWRSEGHKGADRSPAALCSDCWPAYDRASGLSGPSWSIRTQRVGVIAAATGVRVSEVDAARIGLPAWGENHRRGDEPNAEPWGHLPPGKLDELRDHLWHAHPEQAPPELRERVRAENQARHVATLQAARDAAGGTRWEWS